MITGADRIAANGDVANKIGTYEKAVVAKENNISLKRNLALDNSNGDYIFLLDSDQIPESNELLSDCIKK